MSKPSNDGLGRVFSATTPPAFQRAAINPAAVSALSKIEQRAAGVRDRVVAHYQRHQDRWVAKETIRIWQRHLASNAAHPAPAGADRMPTAEVIAKMAGRNVLARLNGRLAAVNSIKARMSNAVVRNLAPAALTPAFKQTASPSASRTLRRQS